MKTEIEAKFTDIDLGEFRRKLITAGGEKIHDEVLMRRKNFDYPDERLDAINGWIRVRDEGEQVTMSYKQLNDCTLHGTKEVNVIVDNFDRACEFLEDIGLEAKSYQESKREKWVCKDVEVTLDTWPWIPSFVELEGKGESELRDVANLLGLDWNMAMHGSVETVYQMHYNFTEKEIDHWDQITFIEPPGWLMAKKK